MKWEIRSRLTHSDSFTLDVDLSLPATGCTVIYGPSGCGKTSLLRSVAGLEPKVQGRIILAGKVLQDDDAGIHLPAHRRQMGVVFQSGALFPHLSVEGNLAYAQRRNHGAKSSLDELRQLLDLDSILHRHTCDLSGGERQRVALARALLTDPQALLLDEPFASIDRTARSMVFPYLEKLQKLWARPSLYVTHNLEEAARLGDHLVLLDDGRVKAEGDLVTVLTDPASGLATGRDACSVLDARVLTVADEDGLARLSVSGSDLWIPAEDSGLQEKVRILVKARDVSLALKPASGTSILNVVPVVIDDLWEDGPARMMVRMKMGQDYLLSAVTRRSASALEISPGREFFAQIKSMAFL